MAQRQRADPWQPAPPAVGATSRVSGAAARGAVPPRVVRGTVEDLRSAVTAGDPDDGMVGAMVESTVLAGTRVLGGELTGLRLRDVLAEQAVLAGVLIDGGGGTRVQFTGGRVSGAVWIRGEFHDLTLEQVRADGVTLRSCLLRRVRFTGCDLSGLDLAGTRLDHVRFEDCDLSEAVFTGTKVVAASFRGCRFDGATGVAGLAGAEVDADSLLTLIGPMAAALGISVS
ncbi:Pentapeptide repeat-containing protein [Frankia sp. EI5c]|uniref:pentapeptide repeat-containing protein n=1 Tax=Frankia sp. EI5c TaxID=683316 RepID=UPI0007C3B584|nr:pentapeptide repeat-containing protein [Frankia sp. EI5c]OAA26373.1 Pentapeptide repeat-containing protein [Frankia sp. EI5c]